MASPPERNTQARALGQRLRSHGETLGLTGAEIARRASISARQYSTYLTGASTPDPFVLQTICAVLGIPMDDLLTPDLVLVQAGRRIEQAHPIARRDLVHALHLLEVHEVRSLKLLADFMRRTREHQAKRYSKALTPALEKLAIAYEFLVPALIRHHAPAKIETMAFQLATPNFRLGIDLLWRSKQDVAATEASFRRLAAEHIGASGREIELKWGHVGKDFTLQLFVNLA